MILRLLKQDIVLPSAGKLPSDKHRYTTSALSALEAMPWAVRSSLLCTHPRGPQLSPDPGLTLSRHPRNLGGQSLRGGVATLCRLPLPTLQSQA